MRAAIGAIVDLAGRPVAPDEVDRMAGRARLPRPAAPRLWTAPGVALLAVPALPALPAAAAPAPGRATDGPAAAGGDAVVVDGTFDNRHELAAELGLPTAAAAAGSEAGLAAAAYRRRGADAPAHLVGEFALLLWDPGERRLLAARDPFGQRELFYTADRHQLRIASQLQMLVARPGLGDVDEDYLADVLASWEIAGRTTPLRSVRRLPAAHRLTVAAAGGPAEIRRYWSPVDRLDGATMSDDEAAERFRALLGEAVARALASGGRAWAELSGGLDSSSIVCLAQDQLAREPARADGFATLTYAWRDTPLADERRWADLVVARSSLPNHRVWFDGLFFTGMLEECRYRSEPHFGILCHPAIRAESDLLWASGVDVLLSGARAEAVVPPRLAPVHLADLLRQLRLTAFARELRRCHRAFHLPLANLLLDYVLEPLFARRRFIRAPDEKIRIDAWLAPGFVARMRLADRARAACAERRFASFAEQLHYEHLVRSERTMGRGLLDWSCEVRHPFLYRPLVELALAIPWQQKLSPEEGRLLLRRSMTGVLPEEIRTRRGGGGPGPDLYKTLARRWREIEPVVRSPLLAAMGVIDRAEFARTAELARFGAAERFVAFLSCLALEYWLRAVTGEG